MQKRVFFLVSLAVLMLATTLEAQKLDEPEPIEPFCIGLECLNSSDTVVSLNLKRQYRKGGTPDTTSLKHLLWLDLSCNRLSKVPDWVCQCTNLRYLNLSRNRLNTLPDCLGKLTKLEYVAANRNPLGSLPQTMASCTHLKYLDLWQTWIDQIPWELHSLNSNLKVVDLRDIRMTREQQMEIYKVFPDVELRLSAWCNCATHKPKR